jgi:AraC family transcriptional regulator
MLALPVMEEHMPEKLLVRVGPKTSSLSFAGQPPILRSGTTPWAGPAFEVHNIQSSDIDSEAGPPDDVCGLLVIVAGQVEVVVRERQREVPYVRRAGSVSYLTGSARRHVVRMRGRAEGMAIQLSKPWLQRLLLDEPPRELGSLPPDPTVLALTSLMRDEVARGAPMGRLYAESLSVAMLSYAFERLPLSRMSVRGSLSDEQQRRLRKYILDRLGDDISLAELAQLVGRKPRQFSTLFRQSFGTTPHRYLVRARVEEGARLLSLGGADVADIALRVGFCSQSHFAEAFRRAYGVTPRRYAVDTRRSLSSAG